MSWFNDITQNPHVDLVLLVDSTGKLVATSNRTGEQASRVASMIKAAEVLARGLSAELGRGEMRTLQVTTATSHLLVTHVGMDHYLIVLTSKDAPLELLFVYMQRLVNSLDDEDIAAVLQQSGNSPLDDIDVDELIEAVSERLHNGGDLPK